MKKYEKMVNPHVDCSFCLSSFQKVWVYGKFITLQQLLYIKKSIEFIIYFSVCEIGVVFIKMFYIVCSYDFEFTAYMGFWREGSKFDDGFYTLLLFMCFLKSEVVFRF